MLVFSPFLLEVVPDACKQPRRIAATRESQVKPTASAHSQARTPGRVLRRGGAGAGVWRTRAGVGGWWLKCPHPPTHRLPPGLPHQPTEMLSCQFSFLEPGFEPFPY